MTYGLSSVLEEIYNKNFAPKFFDSRIIWCRDYETNHNKGIDCYINGKAVDVKYGLPTEEWPEHQFCIETKQKDGTTWLDHNEDILILHWWFNGKTARPVFYRIGDLRKVLELIKSGEYSKGYHYYKADTGTEGYYCTENFLRSWEKPCNGKELEYKDCLDGWYWKKDIWGNIEYLRLTK